MTLHRLLERQVRRTNVNLAAELTPLVELVSATYEEFDQERRRQERTNSLLTEEVEQLNAKILSESEARVRAILDAVSDGVVIVDGEQRIDAFNAAADILFGRLPGQSIGRPYPEIWDGGVAPTQSGEAKAKRPDDTCVDVEVAISEACFADRRCYKIAIVRDVSERKRNEQQLREAMEKAEAASRSKSDFLATMSHEIRTPMNGVLGMVGLLLDGKLEPQERAYAEAIRDSGEALLSILNDILDFSKIEAGRMTLEEYDFAPASVIESVVELLAPRALAKGIEIGVVMGRGVPNEVRGDAGRLRQIVMNLVGNAVKFTETGSVVVEIQPHDNGGELELEFSVVDTGIGIEESVVPSLFGEFVQADASTTRKFGGTGLGLAICRRLALLMGGSIGLSSVKGKGSRFWFKLPFKASTESSTTEHAVAGLRCLIVDDNPVNREIFERQLIPWGVEVTSTPSADGALAELIKAAVLKRPFDVAIVDHHMPGMSGVELGAIIRATPNLLHTRLLLATSGLADDTGGYFDEVFVKPVRPSALVRALAVKRVSLRPPEPAPTPITIAAPEDTRRYRVLVVEDNSINQKVALGYLTKAGHRVDVASNGVEAVSAVRALPYDVVLMDMQMPEMDGLDATRAIRQLGDGRGRVPIIGLTANATADDREACLGAGMDDYLTKPIERTSLLARVEKWGNRRSIPPLATPSQLAPAVVTPKLEVDAELLHELIDSMGQVETRGLFCHFRDGLIELQAALPELVGPALGKRAHQLAGSSGSLGFSRLSLAAKDVDRTVRAGGEAENAKRELQRVVDETLREFDLSTIDRWLAA